MVQQLRIHLAMQGMCVRSMIRELGSMAQMVKNLPAIQETQVRFLGQEDPLEKVMATHSNILA